MSAPFCRECQSLKWLVAGKAGIQKSEVEKQNRRAQRDNPRQGLNPEEILTRDALTKPHATVVGREQFEEHQLHQLSVALKQQLLKEMRDDQNANRPKQ